MSRPGDWRCPQCNNHNFKFRTSCNRCQAAKPDDATIEPPRVDFRGKVRPGDWTCCGCENRNFAFRDICNRCDLPRYVTQTLFSASLLDDEHETSCPGMGLQLMFDEQGQPVHQIDLGLGGSTPPKAQKSGGGGGGHGSPSGGGHSHGHGQHKRSTKQKSPGGKGDSQNWRCSFCWNLNYEFRVRCNRCQMPPGAPHVPPPITAQLGHGGIMLTNPNAPADPPACPPGPTDPAFGQAAFGQSFYVQPNVTDPWGVQVRT